MLCDPADVWANIGEGGAFVATAKQAGAAASTSVRAERTRATRRRMLDAAHDLFVARGYTATTIGAIAERARVAPQTIYFTFTNKRALLKECNARGCNGPSPLRTLPSSYAGTCTVPA